MVAAADVSDMEKEAKRIGTDDAWVCKCVWDDYYDFRVIIFNGIGHVRVSIYPEEVIISDLFVKEDERNEGYGTALLNYADDLIKMFAPDKDVLIEPLTDWEEKWYTRRGYKVIDE